MSAAEALKAARTVGIELVLDGNSLVLEAASEPPAVVLESLSRHKAEIIAMLRPGRDGWSAEDRQAYFDEVRRHFPGFCLRATPSDWGRRACGGAGDRRSR